MLSMIRKIRFVIASLKAVILLQDCMSMMWPVIARKVYLQIQLVPCSCLCTITVESVEGAAVPAGGIYTATSNEQGVKIHYTFSRYRCQFTN